MINRKRTIIFVIVIFLTCGFLESGASRGTVKGIYITAGTARSVKKMKYLIHRAKQVGINTFVIDVYGRHRKYASNVDQVRKAGIRYVARVVMFPRGARGVQIKNRRLWEARWQQAKYAIALGADAIQLDYIRYHRSTFPSLENQRNVHEVIKYFHNKLKHQPVKLEIDVFGVAAHRPTHSIGQNVQLFANHVDVINPMVYPSHYEPYRYYSQRPYQTVFDSVRALKKQLSPYRHVKVYAYIEVYNYRYRMSRSARVQYIAAQIRGAIQAGADGWYAWSANNHYRYLFQSLAS